MEHDDEIAQQAFGVKRKFLKKRRFSSVAIIHISLFECLEAFVESIDFAQFIESHVVAYCFGHPYIGVVSHVEHCGEIKFERTGMGVVGPRIIAAGIGKHPRHIAVSAR